MSTITDYVDISITLNGGGLALAGFGIPCLLSYTPTWVERTRSYTSFDGLIADFPVTTSPEYQWGARVFSQNPRPSEIKIARGALPPTLQYTIVPVAAHSTVYTMTVGGEGMADTSISYTSDATATVAEITAGLTSLINGVAANNFLAVDNSTDIVVTADAAGDWFYLSAANPALLTMSQTHADPGVATDLAAVQLEDNDWYGLTTAYNSRAYALAAAAWMETQKKIYFPEVSESEAATTAVTNDDTIDALKTLDYENTAPVWHPNPVSQNAGGWQGKCLPEDPGSITWMYKSVTGVVPVNLTATQQANLDDRSANYYIRAAGTNFMQYGTVCNSTSKFVDIVRSKHWLEDLLQKGVLGVFTGSKKVAYTDAGLVSLEENILGNIAIAVAQGVLSPDDGGPTVTIGRASAQSATDKGNRYFPDITILGTLQGAVHKARVRITVSV